MEKVSVIIPLYNSDKYMDNAIKSVISQTYENLEIILIDDGSTDSTFERCCVYEKADNRIKCFRQQNKGPASARNKGLQCVSGDWFMFLDSDDYIANDCIAVALSIAHDFGADVVNWCLQNITSNNDKIDEIPFETNRLLIDDEHHYLVEDVLLSLKKGFLSLSSPCCKLYNYDIHQDISFPEELSLGEDTCYVHMVLKHSKRFCFINNVMYYRNIRKNSLSYGFDADYWKRCSDYVRWINDFYTNNTRINKFNYTYYKIVIIYYLKHTSLFRYRYILKIFDNYIFNTRIRINFKNVDCTTKKEAILKKLIRGQHYVIIAVLIRIKKLYYCNRQAIGRLTNSNGCINYNCLL